MLVASLLLILSLVNCSVLGQQEEECAPFDDLLAATEYFCQFNFPTQQLNENCLLKSCPQLSGECPLTADGCVNQTALNSAVSILSTCVGQTGLTCGINMTRVLLVPISWTLADLVPASVAKGTCVQKSGDGYLDNISKARFSLSSPTNAPISVLIQAPIVCEAVYNCTFEIAPASFLHALLGLMPSLNTPRMTGFYRLNVSTIVSIDLSTATPTIEALTDQSDIEVAYSNFVNCQGEALSEDIADLINLGMNNILKKSVATSAAANLLSTYAGLSLKAAQLNCPS